MKVVVLGASAKVERYSHQAVLLLKQYGHEVVPVNPACVEIAGLPVAATLDLLEPGSIDVVTVYIGSKNIVAFQEQLLRLSPRQVILNPGTENDALQKALEASGIKVTVACTLVLLRTGQFAQ